MSLLDFDNDDASINVTTTTDGGFYGNTTSIDDPFGFDVFGSNSAGSVKTTSGSADVAKTGNPFDDFDPFGGFGDSSTVVTTTSNFSTASSSFSKPTTDQFGFDDFSNNNPTNVTETNTHMWGGDDDFHKGGSNLEEPNGGNDVIHDVIHDHHRASPVEEITEVSGDMKESSGFAGDAFWTVTSSSSEQQLGSSSHYEIANPYFDTTVPANYSLGDSYGKTAPDDDDVDDVVEDSISIKETEKAMLTSSHSDIGLVNGKDVPMSPETPFACGTSEIDEMPEENRYHAGLHANGQADISDSETPATTSIHTDSLGGFADSVGFDGWNTKGSNSEWPVHEASFDKEIEAKVSEKTEDKVDEGATSHSKPIEEMPDFQKSSPQDFPSMPLTNHRDVQTTDHVDMTPERETISDESYSFDLDRGRKHDHPMADKDDNDDFGYQFKAQSDSHRHDTNSHRGHEDNSLADYFSVDDRNRGRISIEEIRQRSYEDMEPLRSASSHDRNQKEQKTTTDNKTPSVYVLGSAMDSTCKVCSKRVYEMEKITADLQVYHKTCFRCTHCSRILSLGNFSTNEGRLYCKPHFMELFKTKGNYKDFAAADRNRQQSDRHDASDPEDQQSLNGRSRHSSEENGPSRMRHSSSGREDEYDEADDGLQEEIPVVQIKSVRSMFEKMSQDKSPAAGQPKKAAVKTSQAPQSTDKGQWKQAEPVRRDSLRSEGERDEHERKSSIGDREVIQSSTVCIVEEELPPPSFTKSMLAKFRMMEDVSGGAKPALPNYGKPAPSKTSSNFGGSTARHQTLANRSSSGSNESNRHEDEDNETRTSRQHSSAEDQTDELPQAGNARSLLAQWRIIEEQSKQRGRNRELKKTSTSARRSQSMSRVETVQRASVHRNIDLGSPRSKQAEDIGSYSDQEASEDDAPVSMPTKQSLAKFKQLEGGQSTHETDGSNKAKRKFKWDVKEAVPLNRGGIIVHGDVPRKLTAESADVVRGSEDAADNEDNYDGRLKRNGAESRREFDADSDDAVHQSVLTVFNEDELPAPATTRTLLQHFKSMEDVTKAPPLPRPSPSEAAREARPKTGPAVHSDSDYDEGYRNQKRQSVQSDSEDIQNADEGEEELPAQGTTRSLLAKFQSFQTKN